MDSNRRHPDDRPHQEGGNSRNLEENQRIGRDIYRSRSNQDRQDQYRSGQAYHNQNEGYSPEQTHYGSRPDSAYRDQSRINYGDNRQSGPNQRPDQYQRRDNDNRYNQNNRGQRGYENRNRDFDHPPQGDHAGTRFWGEREEFKQDDYRYTSGNRGNWETPGVGNDHDEHNYNDRYQNRNYRQPNQDEGFFDRVSRRIDNAWDRLTGNDHSDDDQYNRNQHPQNRNFNRGYESGPRWADENDRDNQQNRYNRHDRHDDY